MSTAAPAAPRADACPEPEQLAAFIDGGLPPVERTTVERHLTWCGECRDIVGDAFAERPASAPARRPIWGRLAVAGGLVAAAAAVVLVVRSQGPSPYYVPEMSALVKVETSRRPTEGRISGGFRYAPPPIVTRGPGDTQNQQLAATAAEVRTRIADRTGAVAEAARGVTFLLTGEPTPAVTALERATADPSASPRMWSDLAAAWLARGESGDAERALTAAERAIAGDSSLVEARYNRALALERLQRTSDALDAWRQYAAAEKDAGWAAEAQRHIARLSGT